MRTATAATTTATVTAKDMDYNSSTATSMAGSQSSLPGYESQSSHTHQSQSDREKGSRASSTARSEANSEIGRYNKVKRPINEAVTSAFDEAGPQQQLTPEMLNQITSHITANVLQHLKNNNLPTPKPTSAMQPEVHDSASSVDGSPTIDRANVYTPDSPHHEMSASKQTSPTQSNFSFRSSTRPSLGTVRGISPRGTSIAGDDVATARPKPTSTASSDDGSTTLLEKYWGKFFENGQPTTRLGQFLRGIAMHIIEDYEPKYSLVITPDKLQRYYLETKVSKEFYPWTDVFDDRTSSISRMFRELRVEHHLTQDSLSERPDIPALTPQGFETWMTLVLRADPELESERLAYTALHMPISNPEDKKERFPKELPRCLFPQESNAVIVTKLARAMRSHCHVKLSLRTYSSSESDSKPLNTERSPRLPPPTTSPNGHRNSYAEASLTPKPTRPGSRRASYSGRGAASAQLEVRSDSAIADDPEPVIASQPIERTRKPYVAQPGGGKSHDRLDGGPIHKTQSQPPPGLHLPPPGFEGKLGRSPSVTSNGRSVDSSSRAAPVSVHQQAASAYEVPTQESLSRHRSGSFVAGQPRTIRNRSPSMTRTNDYSRHPENDVKPGVYYPSSNPGYSQSHQWRDARYDRDRDSRSSFSDPRDRGREPRPRFQSSSNADTHRYYANEEDYYRQGNGNSAPDSNGYNAYPPNAYRTKQ